MTEPKPWGTYKDIFETLDKKIKENPEAFEELEKNPYMLLQRKPDAKVYKPNPDTEWLQKMTCEQRRKIREQKERELGLPEGSLVYSYGFWEREEK